MDAFESSLSFADHFQQQGFAVLEKCLSAETVARFVELTELARKNCDSESAVANSAGVYALRNLTDVVPETTELVRIPALREIVETILGSNAFLIRSTLFDKTDGANWGGCFGIRICQSRWNNDMMLTGFMRGLGKRASSAYNLRSR